MNNCITSSYDNRETCAEQLPSSCVPYTGYLSAVLFPDGACRPNVNDILCRLQNILEDLQIQLGDNTTLSKECLNFTPATASQKVINQTIIDKICILQTSIDVLQSSTLNPDNIAFPINLLCLLDPSCEPKTNYTLTEIIDKLVTSVCNLVSTGTLTGYSPINNYSIVAQNLTAATRTYIIGSKIAVPATKLREGTILKWKFNITKTAAGVAASTYDVAVGITGTIGDAALLSFTKPAGTAVVDEGIIEITALVRNLGIAGVMVGEFKLVHNLAATGHATTPIVCQNVISSTFNTLTSNLFIGICATTGAADAISIQMVTAEAINL